MSELSEDEKNAIKQLKRIAKTFPKSLWLFSASGELCVMRKDENNERVMGTFGGVDSDYIADYIDIENDGGDW